MRTGLFVVNGVVAGWYVGAIFTWLHVEQGGVWRQIADLVRYPRES